MRIQDMFERDIDRNINGVIKIEQNDEEVIEQELAEYVVTNELRGHFSTFFDAYERALDAPTDKIGVWISGFFGSGKSHFLKMLSYLLSGQTANGRAAIDIIAPRFEDPMIEAKARRAVGVPTETILFNIDSKGPSNKDKTAILRIFARVFFEHLGFYGEDLKLARLERDIDQKGKTEAFRAAYRQITDTEWLDDRDAYDLNSDAVIDALVLSEAKSREAAERWFDNTEEFELTIDWLVRQINQYVTERAEQEGGQFRLLFMVDEVGQYIGTDTSLMLNLQTIVEDLGAQCAGRVWVVVTSQEAIDEITTVAGQDFSKIQGRFNTRLSLSSTGAGEVIRRRILSKNEHARDLLTVEYGKNATVLKNLFTFKGARNDLGGYDGAESFADAFPFVGYQFKLMQDVINGLRNQGSSGKHLSAERSMLSGFQEVAQALEDRDEHALAPLWMFYNTVQSFLEGYHRRVIDRAAAAARDGAGLEEYDVAVLKLLFLITWESQEMPGNGDNIATLMADDLRANRAEVREQVQAALERLERENYITRNGECYLFLTDDEQEIARQIARTQVDAAKLTKKAAEIVFGQIFETPKITVGKNNFPVAEWLDETRVNNAGGLTLRVLARMDGGDAPSRDELILRSSRGEAIVLLSGEVDFYSCLMEAARIQQFASATIIANLPANQQDVIRAKQQERTALETKAQALMEEAVRRGEFYAGGSQVTITGTNSAKKLIEQCTAKLVDAVYTKLGYIDRNYDDDAQIRQILNGAAPTLEGIEPNKRAIDDVRTFLGAQAMRAVSVSMDDLQKRYQAAPYGWRERDIAAVVAELIAAGEARVSYGGQVVDARDAKMTDCLRKLSMTQRTVVEMRVRASAGDMTRARRAIETLCRVHDLPTEEEPLAAACRSALEERLDGLNGLITGAYSRNRNYPGFGTVADAATLIKDLLAIRGDSGDLLRAIAKAENALCDAGEDLEDVDGFFPDMQRIYDNATNLLKRLDQDRSYLTAHEGATKAIGDIERILGSERPYGQITNLTPAMQTIESVHAKLLEGKRDEVKAQVEDIFASVRQHGDELGVTLSSVGERERARIGAVRDAATLTQLDAVSAQLTGDQARLFGDLDHEHERIHRPAPASTGQVVTTNHAPVAPERPRKVRELQRSTAFLPKTLHSEAEIDAYLAEARKRLVSELSHNDAIKLN